MVSIISQRGIKRRVVDILGAFIIVLVTFMCFLRGIYGTEITDEIFAVSEATLVEQGATPFVNNWTQTPGFSIFNIWFVWAYKTIVGSYEGIFLFSRMLFIFSNIIYAFLFMIVMHHKKIGKLYCWLIYLTIIPFFYLIPNFTYNSISIILLRYIGLCCFIFLENIEKNLKYIWIVGGAAALSIYCHPSDVLAILAIGILFFFNKKNNFKVLLQFCIGGFTVAIILILWMTIRGGGIHKLIYGLDSVLNYNPYFKLGHTAINVSIKELLYFSKDVLILYIFLILFYQISSLVGWKFPLWIFKLAYLLGGGISLIKYEGNELLSKMGLIIGIYLIGQICFMQKNDKSRYIYYFTIIPVITSTLAVGLFSYGSIISRLPILVSLSYVIILDINTWDLKEKKKKILASIICLLLVLATLKANYTYVYRDQSIENLKYRVESGIYKGIYTTKERAETLPAIERYLTSFLTEKDKVLFMEVVPFAYLMTDARACTPSTWDVSLYSYGFNDDTIYQRYFEITKQKPDYIIYIDTGRDKCMSIMKDDYNFTKYVNNNYIKKFDTLVGNMRIITYEQFK